MGNVFSLRPAAARKKVLKLISYTSPGTYSFIVPAGVSSVDVFMVGGGGRGGYGDGFGLFGGGGGGGGECVTIKNHSVVENQQIPVTVGGSGQNSSFGSLLARAGRAGGRGGRTGAVGGAAWPGSGAGGSVSISGGIGKPNAGTLGDVRCRDFGESSGSLNAGGGGGGGSRYDGASGVGGFFGADGAATGTSPGSGVKGESINHPLFRDGGGGGGGYGGGGGGGAPDKSGGAGGHGKVLLRYLVYE